MTQNSKALTFGDTFTLPVTGSHEWTIRDIRPNFAHLTDQQATDHVAYAKCVATGEAAFYHPDSGWSVSGLENRAGAILSGLNMLDVNLEAKTAADYRRLISREVRSEVGAILSLAEDWTRNTDIDVLDLKAHVAAVAALKAAGSDDLSLYNTVYNAALDRLQEQG